MEHTYELTQPKKTPGDCVSHDQPTPPPPPSTKKTHPKETLGLTASMVSSLEFVGEIEESRGQGDTWMAILVQL